MDPSISDTALSSKRSLEGDSVNTAEAKRHKTRENRRADVGPSEGRPDRRGSRGTRNLGNERTAGQNKEDGDGEKKPRLPKRSCALLIGFCGTGCNGMQIQPNVRTIEGVLFSAMVKAGAVSQDNADDPVKVGLARAARTDAGVHAAGNLISIKMITSVPGISDIVARINQELPPEIRLWSFVRTQNSFNAHLSCDSRMYTYFLPSYLLLPPKPDSGLARALKANSEELGTASEQGVYPFWNGVDLTCTYDDHQRKKQWRIDSDTLANFRFASTRYLGTHNFHNFTVGREFRDRSNQRHMKKIEVQDPVVYDGTEWLSILFHGQSFMLHQRKMVCALVLTCRTGTPASVLEEMFGPRKVVVPKAPALGLLLEQPLFESYNRKVMEANAKLENDADPNYRSIIDFEQHREVIDQFKREHIYSRMRAQEQKDATFDGWIQSIDSYAGNDLLYLNPKGVIPAVAVLEKGQPRLHAFREKKRFDTSGPIVQVEEEEEEDLDRSKLKDMEG
ncbi:pseudouridine synthase [Gautieria morchelliformis]|nr:pseudouridine synthase [Gautieria morchelliformis]